MTRTITVRCRYCGRRFEAAIPRTGGRRPQFCPEHRSARYLMRTRRRDAKTDS